MWAPLAQSRDLPDDTQIYLRHEVPARQYPLCANDRAEQIAARASPPRAEQPQNQIAARKPHDSQPHDCRREIRQNRFSARRDGLEPVCGLGPARRKSRSRKCFALSAPALEDQF